MAFRASNVIPEQGYAKARNVALDLKNYCISKSQAMNSDMDANNIIGIINNLKQVYDSLTEIAAITGISDYAQEQESDPTYNVGAEFTALRNAVNTALTTMTSQLPVDGSGYLLIVKFNNNILEYRTFTVAQMATAKSNLDAIVALVE